MIDRRAFCAAALAGSASLSTPGVHAAGTDEHKTRATPYVAQLFDTSLAQQDVSRDFITGSRCAWQELSTLGSKGLPVRHRAIEVQGTEAQLQSAMKTLLDDPACVALCGTVGQTTARWVADLLEHQSESSAPLIQIAPWLHDGRSSSRLIPVFASQDAQIAHALKSLAVVGLKEVGVIFATQQEQRQHESTLQLLSKKHQLQIKPYVAQQGFFLLGLQLPQDSPAVMLFMGGTPELAQFSKGAGAMNRQRFAVGMADINSLTLQQMGLGRNVPVVVTQVVPVVTSPMPLVRGYRSTLSRLFDEPPTALSLSGYISARITQSLLSQYGVRTRAQAAALTRTPWHLELGGHVVDYNGQQASNPYVTQSMVSADGRLIG